MSSKEKRGTKRVCQSCESPFYDLNRDPVICPLCQTAFVMEVKSKPSADLEELKPVKAKPLPKEIVNDDPLGDDLPEVEAGDDELADIETDAEVEPAGEDDTFLEEEEGSSDVGGLIDSPIEGEEGNET